MRVRVIYNYYDRELGFEKKIGDEIEVSDERGQNLVENQDSKVNQKVGRQAEVHRHHHKNLRLTITRFSRC